MSKRKFFRSHTHVGMVESLNMWEAAVKFGRIEAYRKGSEVSEVSRSIKGYEIRFINGSKSKLYLSEVI